MFQHVYMLSPFVFTVLHYLMPVIYSAVSYWYVFLCHKLSGAAHHIFSAFVVLVATVKKKCEKK